MDTQNNVLIIKQQQDDYFQTGATKSWEFRKKQLLTLKRMIFDHYDAWVEAIQQDLRKHEFEVVASELRGVVEDIDYILQKGSKWIKTRKVARSFSTMDGRGEIQQQPYGTVLIISPWNYPVQLTLIPLVGAIGAGNCVIIKPSEMTPATSALMAKLFSEYYDSNYISVLTGEVAVTQALLELPFDKIFFTGSPQVGQIVMEKAAKHLTPVTLELGGKSPAIIDDLTEGQLRLTLKRLFWGKFFNSGQTCIAPDYLLIYKGIEEKFRKVLKQAMQEFVIEKPMCPIINERHYNRLKSYLDDGTVIVGGKTNDAELSIELTCLAPKSLDVAVMKDEIFGPILPIIFYDTKEEARTLINKICQHPLALYVFTANSAFEHYFLNTITFGGASVNDTVSHILVHDLPFGGVRTSGMGNYHGKSSFDCFSREVSVYRKGFIFDLPFRYPPFDKNIKALKYLFYKHNK